MVVWTDNAISHITEFIDEAREDTEETVKTYVRKLIDYTDIFETMPEIGKKTNFFISNYEIRQMIYKKHRIFYHIKGRDIVSGLPKEVKIPAAIVEEKARDQIREICMQAKAVLEVVTPELATDIVNEGIYISGGACGFTKTEEWIKEELKVTVHIKPEPQDHVILGMQSYLK